MYASSRRATTGRRRPSGAGAGELEQAQAFVKGGDNWGKVRASVVGKARNGGAGGVVEARAVDKATPEDGRVSPKKSVVGRVSPKKPVVGFLHVERSAYDDEVDASSCTGFVTVFSEGDQSPARHAGCFALDMFGFSSSTV